MSPLKCSNFFSVSSLKEPPEGVGGKHRRDRVWQIGRSALTQAGMAAAGALGPPPSARWPAGATAEWRHPGEQRGAAGELGARHVSR